MRKLTFIVAVAVVAASFISYASAQIRRRANVQQTYSTQQYPQDGQQYPQSGQPLTAGRYDARQRVTGPMPGGSLNDQQLASWLLVDNRGEIQLARLAQDRASCDEVKDFAKHMVDDHAQMVEDLQRFAGAGRGTQQGAQQAQPDQQFGQPGQQFTQPRQQFTQQGQQFAQGQQGGGLNFVRIKQQLGQQCVASAQHELEQKEGEEFDMCFIGMQLGMHMQMLDTLKVFSRYASPQLDQLIEQAEQTTQEHLDKAKELLKDHVGIEKSSTASHRSSSDLQDRSSTTRESRRDSDSDRD